MRRSSHPALQRGLALGGLIAPLVFVVAVIVTAAARPDYRHDEQAISLLGLLPLPGVGAGSQQRLFIGCNPGLDSPTRLAAISSDGLKACLGFGCSLATMQPTRRGRLPAARTLSR
jgi:hypothetical protein